LPFAGVLGFGGANVRQYSEINTMFAENNLLNDRNMLIYNITFQVDDEVHDNFLIWIKEYYIPEIQKNDILKAPRLCRILSHHEDGNAYSLQWEVESSGLLHRWYLEQGTLFTDELAKTFKDRVVGLPTLMEIVE
jgi:hypothetical protein